MPVSLELAAVDAVTMNTDASVSDLAALILLAAGLANERLAALNVGIARRAVVTVSIARRSRPVHAAASSSEVYSTF